MPRCPALCCWLLLLTVPTPGDSHVLAENLPRDQAAAAELGVGSLLFVPSDIYNSAGSAKPPLGRELGAERQAADGEGAAAAFELARKAADAGDVSAAIQQACRAVSLDPNHAEARRLLGYRKVGEHWAGGYAQQMLESGHLWRPEFGWIKAEHATKYDQGFRPWGNRWISIEEDAERHAAIERGWTVRTDHFLITTNVDRAAGVELAVRLETLYQLWRELFGEFAVLPAELKARLEGKEAAGFLRRPFHVIYHRSRDEYNAALVRRQPQIEITLGIYFDAQRESHFFVGKDQDPGTIAHEAVHQFFYESAPHPTRHLAATANAWAIEGAACYFESLVERPQPAGGRAFTIGTPEAGRLPAARHRRVVDNYFVPLAELSALGITDLQHRDDLARLYSQSAGLASFFLDYRGGVYRKPFRELLMLAYAGRDAADKLSALTGRSFEELDREYLSYMEGLPVTGVLAP
jgi:hypothetical protein